MNCQHTQKCGYIKILQDQVTGQKKVIDLQRQVIQALNDPPEPIFFKIKHLKRDVNLHYN